MESDALSGRMRLALSHLQKAATLLNRCDKQYAAGELDKSRYESARKLYSDHVNAAETETARLRQACKSRIVWLEKQRRQATRTQARLLERVRAGRLGPAEANNRGRTVAGELVAIDRQLAQMRRTAGAKRAADVGGFVDLPLDRYAPESSAAPVSPAMTGARGWVVLAVSFGVLVLAAFAVVRVVPHRVRLAVETQIVQETKQIRVVIRNKGAVSIRLYAPWPGGSPTVASGTKPKQNVGVAVYVKERGTDAFRLLPSSENCWDYGGAVARPGEGFVIEPGISQTLLMTPARLREEGVEAEAFRLVFSRADGRRVHALEQTLAS